MLSTEIVKIINDMRKDGAAILQHKHFMGKIRKVLGDRSAEFSAVYKDQQLIERPCYALPRREACLMVMSESHEVQAKVYDRMVELEIKQALKTQFNVPDTFGDALRLAAKLNDSLEQALLTLKDQAPKVFALDRLETHTDGTLNVTNAAKALQMQPKKLFAWLSANHWIYRRAGNSSWTAYQDRLQSGVLEHKITTLVREDGTEKVVEQVLVTAKGLAKLSLIPVGA